MCLVSYKPIPIPPDHHSPDVDIGQAMWWLDNVSHRTVQRLCESGEIESYLLGGKRRIIFESLKQYRARCVARGPQFAAPLKTGKRPPGRPKSPEASA